MTGMAYDLLISCVLIGWVPRCQISLGSWYNFPGGMALLTPPVGIQAGFVLCHTKTYSIVHGPSKCLTISSPENLPAGLRPDLVSPFEKNETNHKMDIYSLEMSSSCGQCRKPHFSGACWYRDPGGRSGVWSSKSGIFPPGSEESIAFRVWVGWSLIVSGEALSLCLWVGHVGFQQPKATAYGESKWPALLIGQVSRMLCNFWDESC